MFGDKGLQYIFREEVHFSGHHPLGFHGMCFEHDSDNLAYGILSFKDKAALRNRIAMKPGTGKRTRAGILGSAE